MNKYVGTLALHVSLCVLNYRLANNNSICLEM